MSGQRIPGLCWEVMPEADRTSGVAQWLACWVHNPKIRGSKPRSARTRGGRAKLAAEGQMSGHRIPGQTAQPPAAGDSTPPTPKRLLARERSGEDASPYGHGGAGLAVSPAAVPPKLRLPQSGVVSSPSACYVYQSRGALVRSTDLGAMSRAH